MLPKTYIDKFKLRHSAYGLERRRNLSKLILDNSVNFPKRSWAEGYRPNI